MNAGSSHLFAGSQQSIAQKQKRKLISTTPRVLGRASGKRLPPMAEPIGERITRVETELKGLKEGQAQIVSRLDSHDQVTNALSRKVDKVLENQITNAKKTNDSVDALTKIVDSMKPDVQTVADLKKVSVCGKWTIGLGATIIGAMIYAENWLILNWNFIFRK